MSVKVIVTDRLTWAVEELPGGLAFHTAWESEYPLTLCGVVATFTTAMQSGNTRAYIQTGDCEACLSAIVRLGHRFTRDNPHTDGESKKAKR